MDNLETNIKKSWIPTFARNIVLGLEMTAISLLGNFVYAQKIQAQDLTVQAYNQQGNPLPGAQVVLQTPQGTLKGTTNNTGTATFEDVSGTSTVTIAGNGKIGASQSVAIDASKTFKGVIIDGAGITAQILKVTNGVDPIYEPDPVLFNVEDTWPNLNIPVDASAFGTDSTTAMNYFTEMNNGGVTLFVPGKVRVGIDKGIILKRGASYGTNPLTQGGYLFNSICTLKSDLLYYDVKHEGLAHGINDSFGDPTPPETVGYSPSIFNTDHIQPVPVDFTYRILPYTLQHWRLNGIQQFHMTDFNDIITVVPSTAPTQAMLTSPKDNDTTIDATVANVLEWIKSKNAEGDWIRYDAHIKSTSDTSLDLIIKNINDTLRTLPAGTLKDNTTYMIEIIANNNDKYTPSSTTTIKTTTHIKPNHAPTTFTLTRPNIDTVKYDNTQIPIEGTKSYDPDNDPLKYIFMVTEEGKSTPDTTISIGDTSTSIYSGRLKPGKTYIITAKVTDGKDTTDATNTKSFATAEKLTGVKINGTNVPKGWALHQNYPNPCNPNTTIEYELPQKTAVTLKVYDIQGKEVKTLVDRVEGAGPHKVQFDARELSSGVYIYRLTGGEYFDTKKIVVLK